MKRFVSILAVGAMLTMTAGCASVNHQEVELNMEGNDPIGVSTKVPTTASALPVEVNTAVDSNTPVANKEPTIIKANRIENVSGKATFVYQSRNWEGTLMLTESGFYFIPVQGEEVKFPLNSILLVVVKYEEGADYETLILFTGSEEYEFRVETGYVDRISKYILVSEKSAEY